VATETNSLFSRSCSIFSVILGMNSSVN